MMRRGSQLSLGSTPRGMSLTHEVLWFPTGVGGWAFAHQAWNSDILRCKLVLSAQYKLMGIRFMRGLSHSAGLKVTAGHAIFILSEKAHGSHLCAAGFCKSKPQVHGQTTLRQPLLPLPQHEVMHLSFIHSALCTWHCCRMLRHEHRPLTSAVWGRFAQVPDLIPIDNCLWLAH